MKFLMTGRHRKRSGTESEREGGRGRQVKRLQTISLQSRGPPSIRPTFEPRREGAEVGAEEGGRAGNAIVRSVVRCDRSAKSFSIPRVRQVALQ